MSGNLTRRDFLAQGTAFALGVTVLPRHVLGGTGYRAPSDTLNFAVIGMGPQGTTDAEAIVAAGANLVAVCDVDLDFVARTVAGRRTDNQGNARERGVLLNEQFEAAAKYTDFRVMLERQRDIDAVVIATPDHLHAVIAKAAMELGKHVFVEKPLTWSVYEARVLQRVARETGVVTQMGNQGHSIDSARLINEWIQAGIIGPVHMVDVWTDRPIWPQGIPWPVTPPENAPMEPAQPSATFSRNMVTNRVAASLAGQFAKPANLDWDLYLGPVAESIDYHPIYHPFNWRGWVPFGVGALGDMGAHLIDHPYWALGLTYPTSVEATSTPWGGSNNNPATYPLAMTVHYQFPARGTQPPVTMRWYDGGIMPPRPEHLPENVQLPRGGGVIFHGERGILLHETYGNNPRIFPESLREQAERVPQTYPRVEGGHYLNFVQAAKGEAEAASPFEYAAALTEVMLLGLVALRAGQGRRILYDGERMEVTNIPEANQYLTREYREGWSV